MTKLQVVLVHSIFIRSPPGCKEAVNSAISRGPTRREKHRPIPPGRRSERRFKRCKGLRLCVFF